MNAASVSSIVFKFDPLITDANSFNRSHMCDISMLALSSSCMVKRRIKQRLFLSFDAQDRSSGYGGAASENLKPLTIVSFYKIIKALCELENQPDTKLCVPKAGLSTLHYYWPALDQSVDPFKPDGSQTGAAHAWY